MTNGQLIYAGFWIRFGAAMLDTLLIMMLTYPPLIAIYGIGYFDAETGFIAGWADFWISWLLPAVVTIALWQWKSATPGKMAICAVIVDARSGDKPTLKQWIIRYVGYFVSLIPIGLGYLWVAWDPKKQAWHDKMAGTVVLRQAHAGEAPAEFEGKRESPTRPYGSPAAGSPSGQPQEMNELESVHSACAHRGRHYWRFA
ncbi:MAG: RDD family protein [Kiritimatiellae bacterium]|nr:RDD family protein [Kiritimatiellia bacterium]